MTDASNSPVTRSPWAAVLVVLIGSYAAVLNITVVGVALPAIVDDVGASGGVGGDWVVTSFLVGVVVVQPVTGWAADRFGRVRIYGLSLAVFALGGLLCAAAPSMWALIGTRLVQGLGAGAVMPLGLATVYELFPPSRRGTAMGMWGVAIMAAPAVGPPFGGWMVEVASWRLLFVMFSLFAAVAWLMSIKYLPDVGHRERRPLDVAGWVAATAGMVAIVIASRQVADWGLADVRTVGLFGGSAVAIAVVVVRSLRRPHPVLEFRMFAVPTFAAAAVVVWLTSMSQFGQLTFLPIELQVVRELDPGRVGLLLAPAAAGAAITMPLGGWLVDRVGARAPALVGLTLMTVGTVELARLNIDVSEHRIVAVLVMIGIGQGFVFIPTTVASMNSLPNRFVAHASVVNSLNRQMSSALGVAVLSAVVVANIGVVTPSPGEVDVDQAQLAYNRVFVTSAWMLAACIVATFVLPGRRRTLADHRARAAELDQQGQGPPESTGSPAGSEHAREVDEASSPAARTAN